MSNPEHPKYNLEKRRSSCAISCALELIGDKWTLLILRDLKYFNKSAFKDFLASPENIATNILAARLSKLCDLNLIEKFIPASGKIREEYRLTYLGNTLVPILESISEWGNGFIIDTVDSTNTD